MPRVADSDLARLKRRARFAAARAYAPYSGFAVGAAVLTDAGQIFAGVNVENASYGLSMCAERNAIHQAIAHGARCIAAIVVYTPTSEPTPPCGACRQVLSEFGSDALVVCFGQGVKVRHYRLADLLPEPFGSANLDAHRTGGAKLLVHPRQQRPTRRRRT